MLPAPIVQQALERLDQHAAHLRGRKSKVVRQRQPHVQVVQRDQRRPSPHAYAPADAVELRREGALDAGLAKVLGVSDDLVQHSSSPRALGLLLEDPNLDATPRELDRKHHPRRPGTHDYNGDIALGGH